jgi:hypothetical protein
MAVRSDEGVIASPSCSVMAVRSDDHLRQRHEGYLHSDLLVATLRSNREVASSFYKRPSQFFSSTHHPTHHYAPRGPTSSAPECRAQFVLLDVMFMDINPDESTPGQHESKADSVSVTSGQQGNKGIFPVLFFLSFTSIGSPYFDEQ